MFTANCSEGYCKATFEATRRSRPILIRLRARPVLGASFDSPESAPLFRRVGKLQDLTRRLPRHGCNLKKSNNVMMSALCDRCLYAGGSNLAFYTPYSSSSSTSSSSLLSSSSSTSSSSPPSLCQFPTHRRLSYSLALIHNSGMTDESYKRVWTGQSNVYHVYMAIDASRRYCTHSQYSKEKCFYCMFIPFHG